MTDTGIDRPTTIPEHTGLDAVSVPGGQILVTDLLDDIVTSLFGVGLALHSAVPHVSGQGQHSLHDAIDETDRLIRVIRGVAFGAAARPCDAAPGSRKRKVND